MAALCARRAQADVAVGRSALRRLLPLSPDAALRSSLLRSLSPQIFHEGIDSGYQVRRRGSIARLSLKPHAPGLSPHTQPATQDFNHSWTPSTVVGPPTGIWDVGGDEGKYLNGTTPSYHAFSQPDDILLDGKLTNHAVSTLGNMSALKEDKPFFMAVGFHRCVSVFRAAF